MSKKILRWWHKYSPQSMANKNVNGFTLVEVMVAMTILLVGMLGVMGMQYYAVSGNAASREIRIATNLSREIMEQVKGTPYANLSTGTDTPTAGVSITGGITFTRAWWVVPNCIALAANGNTCTAAAPGCTTVPDGTTASPVSAVRARTCWTDNNGVSHSVTLDTLRWDESVVP